MYTSQCRSTQPNTRPGNTAANAPWDATCTGGRLASYRHRIDSVPAGIAGWYRLHRVPGADCIGFRNLWTMRIIHPTTSTCAQSAGATPDLAGNHRGGIDICLHTGKDRKSTRLNSSHTVISYAVFCFKK